MAKNEKLFDQFPGITTEEWRKKVEVDLKGADFNKKLVWRTNEGFNVQPMYRAEDIESFKTTTSVPGEYPFVRGTRAENEWYVRQNITVNSVSDANSKALELLTKGVSSIGFSLESDSISNADITNLLKNIDLAKVEINFTTCPRHAVELANTLVSYLKENSLTEVFKGSINFDPYKKLLKHGQDFPKEITAMASDLVKAAVSVPNLRVLSVEANLLGNAGAYIYQELGMALAWGNEWLSSLLSTGLDIDTVAKKIKFNFCISSNYFMELAKFRAARMLWAQIVKQYNPKCDCACVMNAHAITSEFNQTIYDAHVNLLRSQTESMSAALAGVDSITVTPFDNAFKTPDDFSERIARNQQLLLKEESHLDKIVDPAGGSYYIETLTVSLAQQAWTLFLEIEDKGGFYELLKKGEIQEAVNASSAKRHTDVARRKESLLGTNQFPNFNEMAKEKIAKEGATCGCGNSCSKEGAVASLNFDRAASDFEALRLATENSSKRPKVFMLTIGNLAMRLARSQFSSNFFACSGYQLIDNLGFNTIQEGVDKAIAEKADVVVLCSSDDEYATLAPEAFKAIGDKAILVVAGMPECMEDLKAQGITEFINVRSNVLDTLKAFNAKLLK